MFFDYPQHYPYDHDDFYRVLAVQRARERREAEYRARLQEARQRQQFEEALRRNAYQNYRASERRRSSMHPYISGFDSDEEYSDSPSYNYYSPYEPRQKPRSQEMLDSLRRQQLPTGASHIHKKARSPVPTQGPESPANLRSSQRSPTPPRSSPLPTSTRVPIRSPSPQPDARDQAARKIQAFFRDNMPRYKSLKAISSVAQEFQTVAQNFTFPKALDFSERFDAMECLYTSKNAPVHAHEHTLLKILSKLDSIDSHGDERVRAARKGLVKQIECELAKLDARKLDVWEAFKASSSLATPSSAVEEKEEVLSSNFVAEPPLESKDASMELTEDIINGMDCSPPIPLESTPSASGLVEQPFGASELSEGQAPAESSLTNAQDTETVPPGIESSNGMDVEQTQSSEALANSNAVKSYVEVLPETLDEDSAVPLSFSTIPIELCV